MTDGGQAAGGRGFRLGLQWQILAALVLAVFCAWVVPGGAKILGVPVFGAFAFVGDLFLRGLQMVVMPLVAASVISSIARLAGEHAFARLGMKTVAFYVATSALAIFVGLVAVNAMRPGDVPEEVSRAMLSGGEEQVGAFAERAGDRSGADFVAILQRMIPPNVIAAAANNGEMLALIFFSILFGYFITRLETAKQQRFTGWWEDLYDVMILITNWVIRFAPYGVFGLVAPKLAEAGLGALLPMLAFMGCVIGALAFHAVITLSVALKAFGISPLAHIKAMFPALLTAFSTSSSSATLPLTLECLRERAGVSRRVSGFTAPLGATVNMDGTALYECVAVIFIAQLLGVELGFGQQVLVVVLALLTSIGVAGIPAASLVAIVVIMNAVGLPLEAIGVILATDRLLDMCRTAVNVYSDSCGAAIIARTEGELLAVDSARARA